MLTSAMNFGSRGSDEYSIGYQRLDAPLSARAFNRGQLWRSIMIRNRLSQFLLIDDPQRRVHRGGVGLIRGPGKRGFRLTRSHTASPASVRSCRAKAATS